MAYIKKRWNKLSKLDKVVVIITSPISIPISIFAATVMLTVYGVIVGVGFILNISEE